MYLLRILVLPLGTATVATSSAWLENLLRCLSIQIDLKNEKNFTSVPFGEIFTFSFLALRDIEKGEAEAHMR